MAVEMLAGAAIQRETGLELEGLLANLVTWSFTSALFLSGCWPEASFLQHIALCRAPVCPSDMRRFSPD